MAGAAYTSRGVKLTGTRGTIHMPPARLSALKGYMPDGSSGGTVTLTSLGEQHGPYSGGTTFQRGQEPFVSGDCLVDSDPGVNVLGYFAFD